MAMSVGNTAENEVMVEINTTPLIDVMLVLLIMLIITIPMQTHAVKLDMPRPNNAPPPAPPVVVTLEIDFDGSVYWDGNKVASMEVVESYLAREGEKPREEQVELHVRPSKLAKYQYVATVMSSAQRLGVKKIGIISNE